MGRVAGPAGALFAGRLKKTARPVVEGLEESREHEHLVGFREKWVPF